MPLITTHSYFALDVLEKTPNIKNSLKNSLKIYTTFAQGFDPFIFYEFTRLKNENLQGFCHINNTDTFFLNFLKLIKERNLLNNEMVMASLYGHLTHYILDSTMHPFIVYKTGMYEKNNNETLKYNGLHTKMEMNIDAFLYEQKNKQKFKNFKIHKSLITKEKLNKELLKLLNDLYLNTFSITNGGLKYQKGYFKMYYSYKFIIEDKTGFKRALYHLIDKISYKKNGVFEYYNSHIKNIDTTYLNLNHQTWKNPWTGQESNDSFLDLYDKAQKECISLFQNTYEFLNDNIIEDEYKRILKDKSYVTGLSWHRNDTIKYLEF